MPTMENIRFGTDKLIDEIETNFKILDNLDPSTSEYHRILDENQGLINIILARPSV